MKRYFLKNACTLCFVSALLIVAAAGCVKLERASLDRTYYTLDAVRDRQNATSRVTDKNLIVRRMKVSSRYEDKDLVYQVAGNIYEADYYNAFFVPPASMLTQELKVWMGDSGLFANVLGPESMGAGEFMLEGVVNSLYGDFSGESPKAVIKMQFFMFNNADPNMPIIYSRNFSEEVPIKDQTASALVEAMNTGISMIFAELEKDVAKVVEDVSKVANDQE
ncbi:ABC-type transport auxiliary lipoprotein family protein [Maridesulfovibrio frigidus]|uniref:ABC-type transport auxiliary lipoprotein family protein n=1 Tax=Maridesulfovibrio frigidus TaxID=340956 RepID=UPI000690678F|nr:ABC-type transport auxiliary lipoprotein family protein [Maridesulfovibrio frigidus]